MTPSSRSGCTCRGDRHPDGSLIVTVACPVHHLMPDGCVAAQHEIRCACGEFRCYHACALYERTDDEEYEMEYVCPECVPTMERWAWTKVATDA